MTQTVEAISNAPEAWISLASLGYSMYELSNLGRVRTHRYVDAVAGLPSIMRPGLSSGYLTTSMTSDHGVRQTVFLHRLACAAWNGPKPTPSHCATHVNDIKTDLRPENLKWATRAENNAAAYANGAKVRGPNPQRWGARATLSVSTVRAIRARHAAGLTIAQIARDLGVDYSKAQNVIAGRTYAWVGASTAESVRIENAALAARESAKAAVRAERQKLAMEALERCAPGPVVKRRKVPHTPAASAPRSKGAN